MRKLLSILLSLLFVAPILAGPTNAFVLLLNNDKDLDMVLSVLTNTYDNVIVCDVDFFKRIKLESEITLLKRQFTNKYANLPNTFVANSSSRSSNTLDRLILLWGQKELDAKEIDGKMRELERLK